MTSTSARVNASGQTRAEGSGAKSGQQHDGNDRGINEVNLQVTGDS